MIHAGHVVLPPAQPSAPGYEDLSSAGGWGPVREELGAGSGVLNMAHLAVDRHVEAGRGDATALRCLAADGSATDVTYAELRRLTNRFAHALGELGVGRGDVVASCLGRQLEQYVTCLGALKAGAVFTPLFSSFGPDPIRERLARSRARVLVTTPRLHRRKVEQLRAALPDLTHVVVTGSQPPLSPGAEVVGMDAALATQPDDHDVVATSPEDPALIHFTSGTTGRPKGAVHVHEAVVAHLHSARLALDLRPGDVFWCTADPGWVTGTSYGIIAPLVAGARVVTFAGEFDAPRWYDVLARERVTVWYTAPTALRMLMRHGTDLAHEHDLSALRHVASVGEALNPEVVLWGEEALGRPVHDNWWQTETGAIMVSNYPGMPIRPGSMGRPLPGVEAAVLALGPDGRASTRSGVSVVPPGTTGELALRAGWPSMFRTYVGDPERYADSFADGWYLSGDLAAMDEDGYIWFVGRADDVIKSAGHLIGPFEVESALLEHPAVVEAGVVGIPDEVAGEIVRAYVTCGPGHGDEASLHDELLAFARRRLGGLAPKEIVLDDHLPHNSSGKVMRRVLRARALGLPEGDVSTMERPT